MKTIFTLTVTAALATIMLAQTQPAPPSPADRAQHQVKFLTTLLSLTPTQQQQATTIFTNAATAEATVHDNMKSAHESLQNAVKANDAAAIDQAANAIGELTAQITSTHAKAEAAFYQTLTADQQAKFAQLHERGPRGGGPFPRGGPGGPPDDRP